MRISRLPALAVLATLALSSVANATPQDLRSPDARDAAAARHAQTLQGYALLHAGTALDRARAQEKYYSSYGKAAPVHRTVPTSSQHDSSPWPALAIGLGLIVLVAGAVAVAVRTRRRTMRVAV